MSKRRSSKKKKKKSGQITKKPNTKAKSVGKAKRDGTKFTVDWKNSSKATSEKNKGRATGQRVQWTVKTETYNKTVTVKKGKKKGKKVKKHVKGRTKTVRTVKSGMGKTSDSVAFDRSKYYPKTSQRIHSVQASIVYTNKKDPSGKHTKKAKSATYKVANPDAPSVGASFDADTGTVSFTIRASKSTRNKDRYDTVWAIYRTNRDGGGMYKVKGKSGVFGGDERTVTYDVDDMQQLTMEQGICVRCEAYCRGLSGDSGKSHRDYWVAYPHRATISRYRITGTTGHDTITFYIAQNSKKDPYTKKKQTKRSSGHHDAKNVKLQVLKSTDAATAKAASAETGWEDVSGQAATDDNGATALVDTVTNARPDDGKHVWYRLYSDRDGLMAVSEPVEIKQLYRAPVDASKAQCAIVGAETGEDGTSAEVGIAWKSSDKMTGTELSWSTDRQAWSSTKGPSTYTSTDGEAQKSGEWDRHLSVKVADLELGSTVWVRARRYLEADGDTQYGPYTTAVSVIVTRVPDSVTADGPERILRGEGCRITWGFEGDGEQRAWRIRSNNDTVIGYGTGAASAYTVPAETVEACAVDGTFICFAEVSLGGNFGTSNAVMVPIAEQPSVDVENVWEIQAQPASIGLIGSNCSSCRVHIDVTCEGASGEGPGGDWYQPEGLSLLSADFEPDWTIDDNGAVWHQTVQLPVVDGLHDGMEYDITATVTDPATGLSGTSEPRTVLVSWAHKAKAPSDESTVTDWVDDETGARYCDIVPVAPEGAADTDVCDIYRVTPMGADRIAVGVPFGATYTDDYAPFSADRHGIGYDPLTGDRVPDDDELPETYAELRYRLVTRTADGDEDWDDFDYDAACSSMRIDWPGGYVELPWNPKVSYKFDKGSEARSFLDGGTDAYWGAEAVMTGTMTTDLIRLQTPRQSERVYEMAQYLGACFVRIPDGAAFAADVQLDSRSEGSDGALSAVSLSFTRVRLPDDYKIRAVPRDSAAQDVDETATTGGDGE